MNPFTEFESRNAENVLREAQLCANRYAEPEDLDAATIALILRALELAGGKDFIKPMEIE